MSAFDEDLFLKGLEQRKATLGAKNMWKRTSLLRMTSVDPFKRQ